VKSITFSTTKENHPVRSPSRKQQKVKEYRGDPPRGTKGGIAKEESPIGSLKRKHGGRRKKTFKGKIWGASAKRRRWREILVLKASRETSTGDFVV